MEKVVNTAKILAAATGSYIANAIGGLDALLTLFIWLVVIDICLGILKSIKEKNWSSAVARWGFVNKILEFSVIALCVALDNVIGKDLFLRNMAITWFCICEASSMLENASVIGLPLPNGLVEILIQAKKGFSINIKEIVKKLVEEKTNSSK